MQANPKDPKQVKYSPEQLQMLVGELRQNKKAMFQMLRQSPKVGVYKGQTKEDWNHFYQFYINFLKSQIGPRGECAKKIRKQLKKKQAEVNKILAPFNMTTSNHIRQINLKVKNYIPCPQYIQHKKTLESKERFVDNINRFKDPNNPMVKAISEGMIKKHGKDYPVQKELSLLKENYENKLKEANGQLTQLEETLNKCEGYHNLIKAQNYLQPYFQEWKHADSEIGKQNIKTGQLFQQKVFQNILPYLIAKQKNIPNWYYHSHELEVFTNATWIPRNIGQIDIALGYKDKQLDRYFITTLVECKSRLFDLREAHKQVSLVNNGDINKGPTFQELKKNKKIKLEKMRAKQNSKKVQPGQEQKILQKENHKEPAEKQQEKVEPKQEKTEEMKQVEAIKKFLSTKYGPAELVPNHHFYIVTTLPQIEFQLPIESKMKEGIEKFTKNMFVQDIKSQPFYESLIDRFSQVLSPLNWLQQYESQFKEDESNIIVLR